MNFTVQMDVTRALAVLDFTDMAHAKLWLANRVDGNVIHIAGTFTADELEAVAVLMRERQ